MGVLFGLLLLVAIVCFVGILLYWQSISERRRTNDLVQVAESLGMQFDGNNTDPLGQLEDFHIIRTARKSKHKIYNVMWCDAGSERLAVFDLDYTVQAGDKQLTYKQTLVCFRSRDLVTPQLYIRRQRWYDLLGKILGAQDVDLPEYPAFSKAFLIQGDAQAIQSWIRREFVEAVLENPDFCCEAVPGSMLLYRLGKRAKPLEMKEFLRNAFRIISAAKKPGEVG